MIPFVSLPLVSWLMSVDVAVWCDLGFCGGHGCDRGGGCGYFNFDFLFDSRSDSI